MTKVKALRNFLEKFFSYKSEKMTVSDILMDVTEHGTTPSGGGGGDTVISIVPYTKDTVTELTIEGNTAYVLPITFNQPTEAPPSHAKVTITVDETNSQEMTWAKFAASSTPEGIIQLVVGECLGIAVSGTIIGLDSGSYAVYLTGGEHSMQIDVTIPAEDPTLHEVKLHEFETDGNTTYELLTPNGNPFDLSDYNVGNMFYLTDGTSVDGHVLAISKIVDTLGYPSLEWDYFTYQYIYEGNTSYVNFVRRTVSTNTSKQPGECTLHDSVLIEHI